MKNNYFFKKKFSNIYRNASKKSEVTSQILYGEEFNILSKSKKWIKIKSLFDNYIGYIENKDYVAKHNPKYKIYSLKANIYNKQNKRIKTFLPFCSQIEEINKKKNYIEFEKNKWIKKKDTKKINHYEKNFIKIFRLFLGSKYLWGGKTSRGIYCSALIQIYFYYNRIFFPRDSRDKMSFCKKRLKKKVNKGDIIFWKGHVGMCLSQKSFIHAYGPKKKVLIMPINFTIKKIEKTANLRVKKISNIKKY